MEAENINYWNLALGYLLLLIPIAVFLYYKVGLIRQTLIAMLRMTIQLLLLGVYLEVIFTINNPWINTLWILIMIIVTAYTVSARSGLSKKLFFTPVFLALLLSIILVDTFMIVAVLQLPNPFDARYIIPLTGMLIGNSLSNTIVGMNSFYYKLQEQQTTYRFSLAAGASRREALSLFKRTAIQKAMNPTIATMSVMGLVSLPGMMTGQILGGSNPAVAIKYQILIMLTIFVSSLITLVLAMNFSSRFVFDEFDNLKKFEK